MVGGFKHVLFLHILGIIIPTDFHIFQRGRSTTNDIYIYTYNMDSIVIEAIVSGQISLKSTLWAPRTTSKSQVVVTGTTSSCFKWVCQKIHGRKTRTETDVYHQKISWFIIMFFIQTTDVFWTNMEKTTNIGQSDVDHHFPSRYARKLVNWVASAICQSRIRLPCRRHHLGTAGPPASRRCRSWCFFSGRSQQKWYIQYKHIVQCDAPKI